MELILIPAVICYALFQALCNKWHDEERDANDPEIKLHANKKWHFWQGGEHIAVFSAIGLATFFGVWYILPLLAAVYWFMFDGFRAKTLNKKWFYLGSTAKLDSYGILTTLTKSIFLAAGIVLYIIIKI